MHTTEKWCPIVEQGPRVLFIEDAVPKVPKAFQNALFLFDCIDVMAETTNLAPAFFETPKEVRKVCIKAYLTQNLQVALERWNAFTPEVDVDAKYRCREMEKQETGGKKRGWRWRKN